MTEGISQTPHNSPEKKPIDMDAFRAEFAEYIRQNEAGELAGMSNIEDITVDELTEEDAQRWEEFKNYRKDDPNKLTGAKINEYRNLARESGNKSSVGLMGIIANKLGAVLMMESLDEEENNGEKA